MSGDIVISKVTNREGKSVNKAQLIDAIAAQADVSKATAGRCLDAFVEEVIKSLKRDDTVNLVGFGSFSVKKRAARDGRNPRTGDPIKIAAANVPSSRAGKTFKDSIQ